MLTAVHVLISLMPVIFFLAGLVLIDSYKLVRLKAVLFALAAGFLAATASYFLNGWLLESSGLLDSDYSKYVAPFTEEGLKCIWVVYLIYSDRVGFTVDAAILGFGIGAGFAVVENLYFLSALEASTLTWIIRGFGTAIMHGMTTTVFAIILKSLQQREDRARWLASIIAFAMAYILHSAYNHAIYNSIPPLMLAASLIVIAPVLISLVFAQSEKQTRSWLGSGFDTDQELMKLLMSGDFSKSRIGEYLTSLKEHFEGTIVADMLCLVRIRVELSIRAKGLLMMREAGFEPKPDEVVRAKFEELAYLEKTIGKTGLLAIEPILKWSSQDLWQLNMLAEQ